MATPGVSALLDFTGRVVVVTGAGSGLGRGLARRFAQAGAAVVVHFRSSEAGARETVDAIEAAGGRATALAGDLTRESDAERLVDRTAGAFGRLDVLVNNAGLYPVAGLLDMSPAQWEEVVAANLKSAFLVTRAAAGQMVAQGEGGAVVNVTSIEAARPAPGHAHYGAAKAGLEMLTRSAALELGPRGIRVNAVAPGLVWREGLEQAWPDGVARYLAAAPLGRLGQPEDVADACLFLASPGARWITGACLTVDGGVTATPAF